MNDDSAITLLYRQTSTTEYLMNKMAVAGYVNALLNQGSDSLSITITRQDSSEDSCVFSVTRESWEPEPPTSSSERPRTSPTRPPAALSAAT